MSNAFVISGLVKKRKTLVTELNKHKQQISNIEQKLSTIDKAITFLEAEYKVKNNKLACSHTVNRLFDTRGLSNAIVDTLHESDSEHLTIDEIASSIAKRRGMLLHEKQLTHLLEMLHDGLRRLRLRGIVVEANRAGGRSQFALKRA